MVVYGEVDIEGLDKIAGRAGMEGGSEKDVGTIDGVAAVVVDGSDDGDEAGGCVPARSHGLGGEAIVVTQGVVGNSTMSCDSVWSRYF